MKSLGQRDCWIFDMDGTLTVSMHDFAASSGCRLASQF
jgi:phosphoglycolate phosphatase-like HAD superfamily hydrolase